MSSTQPPGAPWLSKPYGHFAVWAIQSPINLGMILRLAEGFQIAVSIYDPHGVFDDAGKRKTISDFACGALERMAPPVFAEEQKIRKSLGRKRLVATSIEPTATELGAFRFRRTDCIVFGNEYDGLPEDLMRDAGALVNITMPAGYTPKPTSNSPIDATRSRTVSNDGKPNLNVAVSAGILAQTIFARGRKKELRAIRSAV